MHTAQAYSASSFDSQLGNKPRIPSVPGVTHTTNRILYDRKVLHYPKIMYIVFIVQATCRDSLTIGGGRKEISWYESVSFRFQMPHLPPFDSKTAKKQNLLHLNNQETLIGNVEPMRQLRQFCILFLYCRFLFIHFCAFFNKALLSIDHQDGMEMNSSFVCFLFSAFVAGA